MTTIPYVFRCDSVTTETTPGDGVRVSLSLYFRAPDGTIAAAPSGSMTVHAEAGAFVVGTLYTLTLDPLT